MGKILSFGRNNKNYILPEGKGKDLLRREAEAEAAAKALRDEYTDEEVERMKKELDDEG